MALALALLALAPLTLVTALAKTLLAKILLARAKAVLGPAVNLVANPKLVIESEIAGQPERPKDKNAAPSELLLTEVLGATKLEVES